MGRDTGAQAENGFLNFKSGLVGKLEWVHQWVDHSLELVQDESLQGLLDSSHICEFFLLYQKGKVNNNNDNNDNEVPYDDIFNNS